MIALSKTVITPLFDVRLLLIIPLKAYSGLQQAFVGAEFTKYIVKPSLGEPGVGGAMAVYGVFDAICSLAAGRLTSGLRSITFIISGGAFVQAVVLHWLLLTYSVSSGALGWVYPLLIAALWGIGDGVFNTQLNVLLAILFKRDMEHLHSSRFGRELNTMEKSACAKGRDICTTQALAEWCYSSGLFLEPLHLVVLYAGDYACRTRYLGSCHYLPHS